MGVSLGYRTDSEVAPDIIKSLLNDASKLDAYDWWCESILLHASDGIVGGRTKVFLSSYGSVDDFVEVDGLESDLMAYRDTTHILAQLSKWSAKYGVNWEMSIVGELIGLIQGGKWDKKLAKYMDEWAQNLGKLFPDIRPIYVASERFQRKAETISKKYSSRG